MLKQQCVFDKATAIRTSPRQPVRSAEKGWTPRRSGSIVVFGEGSARKGGDISEGTSRTRTPCPHQWQPRPKCCLRGTRQAPWQGRQGQVSSEPTWRRCLVQMMSLIKKNHCFFFSHSLLASDTVFSSIDRLKYSVLKILDWNNIFQSHKLVTKNQDRLTYRWYCSHILTVQSKAELAKTFMWTLFHAMAVTGLRWAR